jgi:hypothetical protein
LRWTIKFRFCCPHYLVISVLIGLGKQESKMTDTWTRLQAFWYFGTKPQNRYRSWSARSADGSIVAVTPWREELRGPAGSMVYWRHGWGDWNRSNGRSFFDDLMWAMANCGGIVRVVVVVRDRTANPRARTADCYPAKDLLMRVVHLDSAAGSFRLEQVVPANFVRAVPRLRAA